MTTSAAVFTSEKTSDKAGIDLAKQIKEEFKHEEPHVVIVFASPVYDQHELLKALKKECTPEILVGCSSAGEFTSEANGVNTASAVALHSTEMKFFASIGRGIKENRKSVVEQLMESMQGIDRFEYKYHSAMLLADALSGYTDEIIDKLTEQTGGTYQFFGGGAGDNAQFKNTCVFFDTEIIPDAVVLLEILSNKPIGLGISHGWYPGSELYRVTEVNESVLISLNAMPAVEVFTDYANLTGHNFDHDDPIPFFLHNILGIKMEAGYKLRVPLSVNSDGSVTCASNLPVGSLVSIMTTKTQAAMEAAETATKKAIGQLQGNKPNIGLFFDCVATRLRLGNNFDFELKAVKNAFNPTKFVGCNTHGQVARMDGQFSGFHNCSAVVCIIPD